MLPALTNPRVDLCTDLLINNAAIAFKAADPTPFDKQTAPTLAVNYYGTVAVTEAVLPLLLASDADPRVVNVASMAGHLRQLSTGWEAVSTPSVAVLSVRGRRPRGMLLEGGKKE